jgi:peptidoglycan-N-acetylglucosamine deacetylase
MKFKILVGMGVSLLIITAGTYMHTNEEFDFTDSTGGLNHLFFMLSGSKTAYIGKDFSLPDADIDVPVYDKYTLRQRREKGLPLTYGKTRTYFYGDHVAYLTFDDGPNKVNTEKILDILKQEKIHATFFLMGKNIEKNPDIVKQIYDDGNAIGLHSYSHDYKKLYRSPKTYTDELEKTEELIYHIIGVRPIISRAPGGTFGHFTRAYWTAVNDLGYIEVGWNALTGDADGTGRTSGQEVTNLQKQLVIRPYLNSHLVILMHDAVGHEATVQALPQIIKLLKNQGYTFRVVTTAIPPAW